MAISERRYAAHLDARALEGLRRGMVGAQAIDARILRVGGQTYVNLASNDYLTLRFHPALIERTKAWAEVYGVGAGASRLVTGNLRRIVIFLFPPIPMPAWLLVLVFEVIELANGVLGTEAGVAHFAHIGGMFAAYLELRNRQRRVTARW